MSRQPLRDVQIVRMPALPVALPLWVPGQGVVVVREEPRVAIVAELSVSPALTVVATHLAFVPGWKRVQLRRIIDEVSDRPDPVMVLGDLNLGGDTPAQVTGLQSLARHPTFPSSAPRLQLDHVLLRGRYGTVTQTSAPEYDVSDHRPLVVDIEP